jgi:hypothetical protein
MAFTISDDTDSLQNGQYVPKSKSGFTISDNENYLTNPDYSVMGPKGEKLKAQFESGAAPPTGEISTITGLPIPKRTKYKKDESSFGPKIARLIAPYTAKVLPIAGMMAGSTVAGTAGTAMAPGVGTVALGAAGAGLGYGIGKEAQKKIEEYGGISKPESLGSSLVSASKNIAEGAISEVGGQVIGKVLGTGLKLTGKIAAPIWGRMTGAQEAPIKAAFESGRVTGITKNPIESLTEFDKSMRGHYQPEDIVNTAQVALDTIKNSRATAYQNSLKNLENSNIEIGLKKMKDQAQDIFKKYVRFDKNNKPIWERSALGPKGSESINKMQSMYKEIQNWGRREGDATPLGLDMLKRQLDDFYAESSNSRSLVTSLRNTVKKEIMAKVPEYEKMTKDYADATTLIKDIESGLMMRKQGMTGRITADQTLRRLMSSMKDNFKLRKDLVDALGTQGGADLSNQISGLLMRSPMPHGLAGTGTAIVGEAALAHFVNPAFWPVVAASSPRIAGEFLRMFGKAYGEFGGSSAPIGKAISYGIASQGESEK